MKNLKTLLLIFMMLCAWSCQDDRLKFPPVIAIPSSLALSSSVTTAQVQLTTNTTINFSWELVSKPEWLDVTPTSSAGGVLLSVTALTSNLLVGKLEDKIKISTSTGEIEIPVSLNVTASTSVQITPSPVTLDYTEDTKQFTIKNNSNEAVSWQLEPSASFISVDPSSGSLGVNESANVTLTIDRSTLDTELYNESLAVKLAGIKNSDVPVSISNFKETKWLLAASVIDAEYDRVNDNLIVVTSDNTLLKLKPDTKTLSSVSLPYAPTCVSVGMSGNYAVVGHEGWVSVIDLTAMTIEKTYAVSTNALDVVLAPNFWAYVFPQHDQWENIRCINLQDGTEVLHTGMQIYAGTKAKLHPSGNYIYGVTNNLSPTTGEKYDISNGQANYLYHSPDWGVYEYSGDLWMADNGSKMFARSKNVFTLSTDSNLDMAYGGVLPGDVNARVQTLDHISSKNLVYAVMFDLFTPTPGNEIRMFSADQLSSLGTIPLPDFLVNASAGYQLVASEGHFGFFNSTGTKFYVILRQSDVPSISTQWAITVFNVN